MIFIMIADALLVGFGAYLIYRFVGLRLVNRLFDKPEPITKSSEFVRAEEQVVVDNPTSVEKPKRKRSPRKKVVLE